MHNRHVSTSVADPAFSGHVWDYKVLLRVWGYTEMMTYPRDMEGMASPRSGSRPGNGSGSEQVSPSTPAIQRSFSAFAPFASLELQSRL